MASNFVERENVENKSVSIGELPKDIWESITAFSNAGGGVINPGILPDGSVKGVDPRHHDKLQREIITSCKESYSSQIYPDITIEKSNVVAVYIPPAPAALRPVYSKKRGLPKGARVRVGTSNVQLDGEWVRRFAIAARGGAEVISFPGDYKQYFDEDNIETYLSYVRKRRGDVYKNLDREQILRKMRALNEEAQMTLFGLLAFSTGTGLQELTAPTVNVAVTQYAGKSKSNPSDPAQVSLDDKEFPGSAPAQFENALKFIKSKLPVKSAIVPGGRRMDYLAVPEVAVRETLANAIAHRDYTTYSGRVQIDIYSDRIEFTNPGRSLVPLERLESAPSQTRNPLLMNYLRDLAITEHRGRGIVTIKRSLMNAGLHPPVFEHRHDWFVAILYSSAFIDDTDRAWLQKFKGLSLKDEQLRALVHVKHNPDGITNSEYRRVNNMISVGDDIRAKKDLVRLVRLGLLEKRGARRYTRYVLT